MRLSTAVAGGLLAAGQAWAQCEFVNGNYYCSKAGAIEYANVGYSGHYLDVREMNEKTCACRQEKVVFGGPMSPLNQELSVHFRGPIRLKQFGVYYPAGDAAPSSGHKHKRDMRYVEVTSTVYVNAKGERITKSHEVPVQHTELPAGTPQPEKARAPEEPSKPSSSAEPSKSSSSAESSPPASPAGNIFGHVATKLFGSASTAPTLGLAASSGAPSSAKTSSVPSSGSGGDGSGSVSRPGGTSTLSGSWKRSAYYRAGSTENCTFFNHQGGSAGSGTWSSCFGNSISFAAADGVSGASKATPLDDVTLRSDDEFIIFSGAPCTDTSVGDCGYHREGIDAYHGFGGATKLFIFEFTMPIDPIGNAANQDMPAIWLLNAKIPRTLQYGNSECSCWKSGCGEMDIFEVLTSGSQNMISHIHDGQGTSTGNTGGGGSQDYFQRPVNHAMKAAVIFDGTSHKVHIVEVEDEFTPTLSPEMVASWIAKEGSVAALP